MIKAHQHILELGHTPVSYSALKKFRSGGIHEYFRYKERELEPEESASLDLGTLIDEYLLNREEFDKKFILNTAEAPGSPNQLKFAELVAGGVCDISEAYKRSYASPPKTESKLLEKAQDLYQDLQDYIEFLPKLTGKIQYSEDNSFALSQISMNMQGHKVLRNMFPIPESDDANEYETHVQLEGMFQKLPIRGELDMVHIDHVNKKVYVYDMKSTSYYLKNFKWQVKSQDYIMQAVLYSYLAYQNIVPDGYKLELPRFIAVRTQGDYGTGIFQVPKDWYVQEVTALREDFKQLTWHYEHKKFKYSQAYYESDGVLELEYLKDMDLWKQEIEQSVL
jgi:hypothetical protein